MENQAMAKSYRSQETTLTRRLEAGWRISEVDGSTRLSAKRSLRPARCYSPIQPFEIASLIIFSA